MHVPFCVRSYVRAAGSVDYETYLSATPGTVDIFFPTDFTVLEKVVSAMLARSSPRDSTVHESPQWTRVPQVWQPRHFFTKFGETAQTRTMTGALSNSQCPLLCLAGCSVCACHRVDGTLREHSTGYNPLLEDYSNTRILTT
jgi:hypothetical protein